MVWGPLWPIRQECALDPAGEAAHGGILPPPPPWYHPRHDPAAAEQTEGEVNKSTLDYARAGTDAPEQRREAHPALVVVLTLLAMALIFTLLYLLSTLTSW
jgi:hypothetical protein